MPAIPVTCRLILPFFLLALAIRILIALQDVAYLDRLFLPDDTYYTLAISKNIFFNALPSTNGEVATSGFQPLITLFQLPIFMVTDDLDAAVKGSIYLSAVIGALSTILLGLLMVSLSSPAVSRIAMLLFAVSPAILINDLNGLETSLAGCLALLLCLMFTYLVNQPSRLKGMLLGVCCSLALLSRIDSAFLVLFVGFGLLLSVGFRWTVWIVVSSVIFILPWWVYLFNEFGSIAPESGKAVKLITESTP
ncbi:MAG: hypothetical protein OXE99_15120, partial [Cellvibrionales bacterium]|nr:hypothetical protein [Cellvibrionales bacterium]